MNKIATHNSATGEKGRGILSFLVAPFSKCQSKTLKEQYDMGARYFDIRYKWSKRNKWSKNRLSWVCAHGLWESEKELFYILKEINDFGDCYVMMTCESGAPLEDMTEDYLIKTFTKIQFTSFNVKHPEWKVVRSINHVPSVSKFKILDWSTWHTLIPIPWLWKKIYFDKPEFNEDTFTMVDFL